MDGQNKRAHIEWTHDAV